MSDLSTMLHEAKDKLSELEGRVAALLAENGRLQVEIAALRAAAGAAADAADEASRLRSVEQAASELYSPSADDGSDTPPYAVNGDGTAEMEDDGGEDEQEDGGEEVPI